MKLSTNITLFLQFNVEKIHQYGSERVNINKDLIYTFLNQDSQCKIVNIMLIESNPNSKLAFSNS